MAISSSTGIKKNVLHNLIARVVSLVSIFLVNILFSRVLGAADSGQLYYVVNNFSFVILLSSLSMESGMTYFMSKKEIDEKELVTISIIWSIIVGITVAIILFLSRRHIPAFFDHTSLNSFLFISGTLLTTYFSALFFGKKQFVYPHLVPALINILLMLYVVITPDKSENVGLLVTVYFGSSWVSGIVMTVVYHIKYGTHFSLRLPSAVTYGKLYKYSGLAFITNIISFLAYRVDYWILQAFSPRIISEVALGNYIQVSKLVQLFLFLPTILATIIFPMSASSPNRDYRQFRKMTLQVLFLNITGCIIAAMIGKWFFPFVYGKTFGLMYSCFLFSVPVILAMTVVRIVSSYFAGINRIKYNLIGCCITLATVILMNFLLIPSMGINGSALADSIGYLAYMLVLLYFIKRIEGKDEKHIVGN